MRGETRRAILPLWAPVHPWRGAREVPLSLLDCALCPLIGAGSFTEKKRMGGAQRLSAAFTRSSSSLDRADPSGSDQTANQRRGCPCARKASFSMVWCGVMYVCAAGYVRIVLKALNNVSRWTFSPTPGRRSTLFFFFWGITCSARNAAGWPA